MTRAIEVDLSLAGLGDHCAVAIDAAARELRLDTRGHATVTLSIPAGGFAFAGFR